MIKRKPKEQSVTIDALVLGVIHLPDFGLIVIGVPVLATTRALVADFVTAAVTTITRNGSMTLKTKLNPSFAGCNFRGMMRMEDSNHTTIQIMKSGS